MNKFIWKQCLLFSVQQVSFWWMNLEWLSDLNGFLTAIGCSRMNGFLGKLVKKVQWKCPSLTVPQHWSSPLGFTLDVYMFTCCQSSPLGFMLSFKPQRHMFIKPKHIMIMFIKPIGLHAVFQASKAHVCQAKTHHDQIYQAHWASWLWEIFGCACNQAIGFTEGCWTCGYCMNILKLYSNCMLKVFRYSYVCLECLWKGRHRKNQLQLLWKSQPRQLLRLRSQLAKAQLPKNQLPLAMLALTPWVLLWFWVVCPHSLAMALMIWWKMLFLHHQLFFLYLMMLSPLLCLVLYLL